MTEAYLYPARISVSSALLAAAMNQNLPIEDLQFVSWVLTRCTPHLSHLNEVAAGTLNRVCYMWWDEFP